jgi:hypothetical protein
VSDNDDTYAAGLPKKKPRRLRMLTHYAENRVIL